MTFWNIKHEKQSQHRKMYIFYQCYQIPVDQRNSHFPIEETTFTKIIADSIHFRSKAIYRFIRPIKDTGIYNEKKDVNNVFIANILIIFSIVPLFQQLRRENAVSRVLIKFNNPTSCAHESSKFANPSCTSSVAPSFPNTPSFPLSGRVLTLLVS